MSGAIAYGLAYAALVRGQRLADTTPTLLYQLPGMVATVAVTVRASRASSLRTAWLCLAAALWSFMLGDSIAAAYSVASGDTPGASAADVFYYAGYLNFLAATVLFVQPKWSREDPGWLFDLAIILLVVGGWAAHLLIPAAVDSRAGWAAVVATGYPLADIALLAVILLSMYAGTNTSRTAMLVGAVALAAVGDPLYYLSDSENALINLPFIGAYWLLGAFALVGPGTFPQSRPPRRSVLTWKGVILPYAAACAIVGMAALSAARGDRDLALPISAVLVLAVVVGRQLHALRGALTRERELASFYEAMLAAQSSTGEAMLVLNGDRIELANDAAQELTGYSQEDLQALPGWRALAADENQAGRGHAQTPVSEFLARRKDGSVAFIEYATAPIVGRRGSRTLVLGREITERKEAESRLQRQQEDFHLLFAANPEPMWLFDRETLQFVEVNDAAVRLYGFTREQFLQMSALDIRPPSDRERLKKTVHDWNSETPDQGEWTHVRKDGTPIWVHIYAHNVQFRGRERLLVVASDVTERRLVEEELLQAQKMESVGRLAGGVAHDFNNLLTVILGYSQMAAAALPADSEAHQDIEESISAANKAAALTRQLLAFARKQIVQPADVEVNELLRGMDRLLRRLIGEDVELVCDTPAQPVVTHIDPGQFEQVIVNLAVNARDAMPKGGKLTISSRQVAVRAIAGKSRKGPGPGDYALVSVTDTGSGMTPEVAEKVFEPFFTTKEPGKGTGLGLATCYGIVQQAGGTISVDSDPGLGSTFSVYLPVAGPAGTTA